MQKSFYHCVNCHSEEVAKVCLKLDYLGITFNITITWISAIYFGFYEHTDLATWYISILSICGSITFYTMLNPNMDGSKAAVWRSIIFLGLGACGFLPLIHAALDDNISLANFPSVYIFISSTLYVVGTLIYVSRTPERYWPGVFDHWGSSHQIFHVLVNFAQVIHLVGLLTILFRI